MKRTFKMLAILGILILVALITVAFRWTTEQPNLDFSEGCLRGYLWNAGIQHIACSLPPEGGSDAPRKADPITVAQVTGPSEKDEATVVTETPADQPDRSEQPAKDKQCPKADNTNKQGHHNCGKGPGPGEHDNGNGNGNRGGQEKGKGHNK